MNHLAETVTILISVLNIEKSNIDNIGINRKQVCLTFLVGGFRLFVRFSCMFLWYHMVYSKENICQISPQKFESLNCMF